MKTASSTNIVIVLLAVILVCSGRSAEATKPAGNRMAWFNEAKFGLFLHWGPYAVPTGEFRGRTNYGEWFQIQFEIPNSEYEKYGARFNPMQFDARAWAKAAREAGMKYVVITAKHHDGFAMFHSKLTNYNIVDFTPYHHDPMKDLADAVRAEGLKFCFYYSIPDWHHRDFPAKYTQKPGFHGDPKPDADLEKYVEYVKGQVRELLTNYGPIAIMWFDGGGAFKGLKDEEKSRLMHSQEIMDEIHRLQPDCLVNNRLYLPGDYGTPEQKIPGAQLGKAFEVCMTLNKHWGFNAYDHDYKTPSEVIRNLADIASKGGNYLLNVGPTPEGTFPAESVRILKEVGAWLTKNGEAFYGTERSPQPVAPSWGRITRKGTKLYLHVFDWPADDELKVELPKFQVKSAVLLAQPDRPLTLTTEGGITSINLPVHAPDLVDSIIAAEVSEKN